MISQDEYVQEQEECVSFTNSFDFIVNVLKNYTYGLTTKNELHVMKDEISIPDTENIGCNFDTYFTNMYVKGLKNFESQNVTMSWGEDSVSLIIINIKLYIHKII